MEVPISTPDSWAALEAVASLRSRGRLGIGTVLTSDQVERSARLGCSVVVSPGLDPEVVHAALDAGMQPLPGVLSPSEITVAVRLGIEELKLFPAGALGVGFVRSLRGPFPTVRLLAVGGIDKDNAFEFIANGASGVAFGSSLETLLDLDDCARIVDALNAACSAPPADE